MSVSTSRLSYADCYALFEAAQADPLGARLPFSSRAKANEYRLRMNTARVIDRKENKSIYEPDHALYGRSAFDRYIMRINLIAGQWYVYVEPCDGDDFIDSIEPLSEVPPCDLNSQPSGEPPSPSSSESPSPPTTESGLKNNSTPPEKPPTTPLFRRSL